QPRSTPFPYTTLFRSGGSWPQLGSDGAWQDLLRDAGIEVAPLQSSNCGFDIAWSAHFAGRHAGAPLKPVVAHWRDPGGSAHALQGECGAAEHGSEGSLDDAISADLRELIARDGHALIELDLAPGRERARLQGELSRPRGKRSLSEHLRRAAGLDGARAGLLREVLGADAMHDPAAVAVASKR